MPAADLVAANTEQTAALTRQLEELSERRKFLALSAAQGDKTAADQLGATESAIAGVKTKIERLQLASDGLSARAAEEAADAEAVRRRAAEDRLASLQAEQQGHYRTIETATAALVDAIRHAGALALQLESAEGALGRPRRDSVHSNQLAVADYLATQLLPVGVPMLPGRPRTTLAEPEAV